MSKSFIRLPDDYKIPVSVNDNHVTEKQRSIQIDITNTNPHEYFLNLFWAKDKQSELSHIGKFKLNLMEMVKEGYLRQESSSIIRLIMIRTGTGDIYLRLNKKSPEIHLGNINTRPVMLANLSYNIYSWRAPYINPKAKHEYANKFPGHESLNFNFYKNGIDCDKYVHGYFQWTNDPVNFKEGGTVIFYSMNTEKRIGEIVGVYGGVSILDEPIRMYSEDFENNEAIFSIRAEKNLSMLFPIPMKAEKYKTTSSSRLVGQTGYSYYKEDIAIQIILDQIKMLVNGNGRKDELTKLQKIYEHLTNEILNISELLMNNTEENELYEAFKNDRDAIVKDLNSLEEFDDEQVEVKGKKYKRDLKTIIQLKILRDYQCQICSTRIRKSNGSFYIEAAHIKPKSLRGRETPDNILILCPNHHKEFDYGSLNILEHDEDQIRFSLNKRIYDISLKVE